MSHADLAPSSLQASFFGPRQPAANRLPGVVPAYTPLWYAARVLKVSAGNWWEDGVPPARRRRQRAAQAITSAAQAATGAAQAASHAAVGMARSGLDWMRNPAVQD
ncbi:MAG: hypothetical protein V4505_07535 [Pseudomonadota bacterium]